MVTFVPRFLFEQFSQVAYFYFLVQVCAAAAVLLRPAGSLQDCTNELAELFDAP